MRLRTLQRLWRIYRSKPHITITESGQLTSTPHVHVGISSLNGMTGVHTYDANDAGHAMASMDARGLRHLTHLPVLDKRANPEVLEPGR